MRTDIATMKGELVQEVRGTLLKDSACNSDGQNDVNSNINALSSVTSVATEIYQQKRLSIKLQMKCRQASP